MFIKHKDKVDMDELPFLDTHIARTIVTLSNEHFRHFCNEFKLPSLAAALPESTRQVVQYNFFFSNIFSIRLILICFCMKKMLDG